MINLMSNVPHPALPLLTFSCPSRTQSSKGHLPSPAGFHVDFTINSAPRSRPPMGLFVHGDFLLAPKLTSSHGKRDEGVVISRCPGTRVGALQKVPRPLGRAKDRGPRPSARPRSCTRDIIFLINKGDMMGM